MNDIPTHQCVIPEEFSHLKALIGNDRLSWQLLTTHLNKKEAFQACDKAIKDYKSFFQ